MNATTNPIATPEGLERFLSLHQEAVEAVVGRFDQNTTASYGMFGVRGRAACREDVGYQLEFLRPAVEFGTRRPILEYVRWVTAILGSRGIPSQDLTLSLSCLMEFFASRLDDDDARPIVAALNAAITSLRDPSAEASPCVPLMPEACEECDAFGAALICGDQRTSVGIFREVAQEGRSFLDAELHLVQPALYGIGKGWQDNRISIAQEHLATAMVHGLLAREFAQASSLPSNGRSALLAAVEGNEHIIGLRMVADAFELSGWDVHYLGANMPTTSLVKMVRDVRPDVVGLSVAMPHHLRPAREAIAGLHSSLGEACPALLLGGLTINHFAPMKKVLGADGTGSDARSAVEAAELLVASP
ncbi:cobalamin B12-binding domain-containing protein [Paludisphaera mucosa]|uniref:Cobalamin-dependent protein n=1 Tax=Paludisphaera mucosa TaxID=3030827 RepID=A0ABT6FLM1_9BACT|nr:cobalamin-dependent protein [Paludisphaera mucosa]MDG3008263.1 cobalamin-dependent protein [Paludisphaera mucosa]